MRRSAVRRRYGDSPQFRSKWRRTSCHIAENNPLASKRSDPICPQRGESGAVPKNGAIKKRVQALPFLHASVQQKMSHEGGGEHSADELDKAIGVPTGKT